MSEVKQYVGSVVGKSEAKGFNSPTYKVSVDIGQDRTVTLNTKDKSVWEEIEMDQNYEFNYGVQQLTAVDEKTGKPREMKWINGFKAVEVDHPTEEEVESDNMNREIDIKDVTF